MHKNLPFIHWNQKRIEYFSDKDCLYLLLLQCPAYSCLFYSTTFCLSFLTQWNWSLLEEDIDFPTPVHLYLALLFSPKLKPKFYVIFSFRRSCGKGFYISEMATLHVFERSTKFCCYSKNKLTSILDSGLIAVRLCLTETT